MRKLLVLFALAVLAASISLADDKPKADEKPKAAAKPKSDDKAKTDDKTKTDAKEMSGISILGNQEAPKSLVIVPWKSSEIGAGIGLSNSLNDRAAPVDKDVFGRQLRYYEIRSGEIRPGGTRN
jgi:hypothetical protein